MNADQQNSGFCFRRLIKHARLKVKKIQHSSLKQILVSLIVEKIESQESQKLSS